MDELILYYDKEEICFDELMHIVDGINTVCMKKVILLPNVCQLKQLTEKELIFVKNYIDDIYKEMKLGDKND